MNHTTCRILTIGLTILGIVFVGLGIEYHSILAVIGVAIGVTAIILSLVFLRCHHCGGSLNMRGWLDEYCRHCGEELEKEE